MVEQHLEIDILYARACLDHLWYVIKHKWYVLIACCHLGIPWLGIVHDLSKFSWAEFGAYSRNFYEHRDRSPSENDKVFLDFQFAWYHHWTRNRHHPEHWVLGSLVTPMPDRYIKEMIADWYGAGRAKKGGIPVKEWYFGNEGQMRLHPQTRRRVKTYLEVTWLHNS